MRRRSDDSKRAIFTKIFSQPRKCIECFVSAFLSIWMERKTGKNCSFCINFGARLWGVSPRQRLEAVCRWWWILDKPKEMRKWGWDCEHSVTSSRDEKVFLPVRRDKQRIPGKPSHLDKVDRSPSGVQAAREPAYWESIGSAIFRDILDKAVFALKWQQVHLMKYFSSCLRLWWMRGSYLEQIVQSLSLWGWQPVPPPMP